MDMNSISGSDGKTFHKECTKEIVIPNDIKPSILTNIAKQIAAVIGPNVEQVEVVTEALAKNIRERINKSVRKPKVTPEKTDLKKHPSRVGDTNSKKTSRGRANFRGIRKNRMDRKRNKKIDKYTEWGKKGLPESTMYIMGCYKADRQVIVEEFNKCNDIHNICITLDKLSSTDIDKEWLAVAKQVARNLAESRIVTNISSMAKLGDWESENAALAQVVTEGKKLSAYYPNLWVEHQEFPKNNASIYVLINENGDRLSKAQSKGVAIMLS